MDKKYYTPLELLKIAAQHAYCAEHLLRDNAEIVVPGHGTHDTLAPFISLMYMAFELTFKAYLLQDFKTNNQHKNLVELLELTKELGLSNDDIRQLKNLARQHAFRKGVDYELWEDRQQLHVFCVELVDLYERLQQLIPLELQNDYHD